MKLKSLLAAFAAAGISMTAPTAAQADVVFNFSGECWFNCSAINVPPNTVSGFINVVDNFASNLWLSASEVTSFSFNFGSVQVSSSNGYSVGGPGYLVLPGNVLDAGGSLSFSGIGPDATTLSFLGLSGWKLDRPGHRDPWGPVATRMAVKFPSRVRSPSSASALPGSVCALPVARSKTRQ